MSQTSNNRQRKGKPPAEKTSLYDEASERMVIGFLLANPDRFWDFSPILKPEHFDTVRLGRIWAAMLKCGDKGQRPKRDLVKHHMRGEDPQDTPLVMFLEILMNAAEDEASMIDIDSLVEVVILLANKRALIEAHQEAIMKIKTADFGMLIEDIQTESISTILAVNAESGDRYMKTYAQVARELAEDISADMQRGPEGTSRGLRAGLRGVEEVIGPLLPGKVVVIGGMSSAGKTAICSSIMEAAALDAKEKDLGVAYMASMEMTGREHASRNMAGYLGISSYKLERSDVNQDEYDRIVSKGLANMARYPIMIDRKPFLTLDLIRSRAMALKNRSGLSLMVIDHLLLVKFGSKESMMDRVMESVIWAKIVAGEMDVPLILLSQVNEPKIIERKSGEPIASDLFGGQAIQQNADVTAFIHRPEIVTRARGPESRGIADRADYETLLESQKGKAFFYNLKGRGHGAGNRRELRFDGPTVQFQDVD